MADMRSCVKTGCRWPAAATLSYRYASAEVWLSDLQDDHPATHDLCPHHADSLSVPRGWSLVDRRQPQEVPHEPSAAEIVERAARLRRGIDAMLTPEPAPEPPRASRYDELLRTLPVNDDRPAAEAVDTTAAEAERAAPSVAVATRELTPLIRQRAAELAGTVVGRIEIDLDDRGPDRSGEPPTVAEAPAAPEPDPPVSDPEPEPPVRRAQVVQLPLRHLD